MSLLDVNYVKCHFIAVLPVEFVECRDLPAEGRSRVAAKHQHNRPLPFE